MEVVGEVESGLLAAAWSPDEEQLVLVTGEHNRPLFLFPQCGKWNDGVCLLFTYCQTGEDKVIAMSREFDVLYESPLRPESFGEGELRMDVQNPITGPLS